MFEFNQEFTGFYAKGNTHFQLQGKFSSGDEFFVNITLMSGRHAVVQAFCPEGLASSLALCKVAMRRVGCNPDGYQWTDQHKAMVWDLNYLDGDTLCPYQKMLLESINIDEFKGRFYMECSHLMGKGKRLADICTDYLMGLPSEISFPYENADILVWLSQQGEDFKFPGQLAVNSYWTKLGEALAELLGGNS